MVEDGKLEIGPLANLPVIKDLAADMRPFFEKWQAAKGVFAPSKTRADPIEKISPTSAPRIAADAAIECINCAVCFAACDTVRWNEDYLGPAALNRAWTLVNDVTRRRQSRAAFGDCGRRRLPRLPFAPELPGALPQQAEPDRLHRRPQAAHDAGVYQGGAVMLGWRSAPSSSPLGEKVPRRMGGLRGNCPLSSSAA